MIEAFAVLYLYISLFFYSHAYRNADDDSRFLEAIYFTAVWPFTAFFYIVSGDKDI